ncbi:hypothetical protein OEZ85_000473 [Tetradesmus obliquus]|uniref:Uncharacterized protein n=1 Tax=Tetradesmus obliquus TaxID=3088 RepID=A0ABY8ULG0_TETOB|nr:hypothetical protein OEZ85_000473 [Tetradesmus obliquus]
MGSWIDAVGRQSPFSEFGKLGDEAAMVHYIVRLCGPPSEWSGQNESLPDEEPEDDMEEEDAAERALSGFAALLVLPGAKAIQPGSLASLVSLARRRGHLRFVQCMIRAVPAAQQLPSRMLCDALLAAGAAERRQLVQELAEL